MSVFRVVLEMEVDGDDAPTFQQHWETSAASFRDVPGILAQTLATDTDAAGHFTITSDWTDERHFRAFEVSTRQDDATAALRRLRRSSNMRTQQLRAVVTKGEN
jgi:heme oxygenase (mycobilin-producing)